MRCRFRLLPALSLVPRGGSAAALGRPPRRAARGRPTGQRAAQCGGRRRLLLPSARSGLELRSRCSSKSGVCDGAVCARAPRAERESADIAGKAPARANAPWRQCSVATILPNCRWRPRCGPVVSAKLSSRPPWRAVLVTPRSRFATVAGRWLGRLEATIAERRERAVEAHRYHTHTFCRLSADIWL
jgi:hypothetical protein